MNHAIAMSGRKTRLALSIALSVLAHAAFAHAAAGIFHHLTIANGLSQNSVNAIVQDHHGFLWFGTQDGLDRFDGRSVLSYRHSDRSNSLANNYIWSLLEDADGGLWVGTFGGGLDRLDPATGMISNHRRGSGLSGDRVVGLLEHPAGTLWVRTSTGLDRIDRATGTVTQVLKDVFVKGDLIGAMAPGDEDHLLLRTSVGLSALDFRTGGLRTISPGTEVTALARVGEATYMLDRHRLVRIDPANGAEELLVVAGSVRGADPRTGFHCMLIHNGHAWVGTTHGLIHRDPQGRVTLHRHDPNDPRSLADDHVLSLHAGKGGEIWVGTRNGLDRIDQVEPVVHGLPHVPGDPVSLPHASVTCLLEDGDKLWIGSPAGLSIWDRSNATVKVHRNNPRDPRSLSADYVLSLARNAQGEILVGTLGGGVQVVRGEAPSPRFHRIVAAASTDPQRSAIVHGLHTARDGRTWIATGGAGLCSIGADGVVTCSPATGEGAAPHPYLFTVMEDDAGFLWMGSAGGGLLLFDPMSNRFGAVRRSPEDMGSLSDDLVLCTYLDEGKHLWVGTANGLCRTRRPLNDSLRNVIMAGHAPEGIFNRYGRSIGLPNEVVYGILADGDRLWLSTNGGLAQLDRRTGTVVRTLARSDGLLGEEFNQNAYLRAADGTLYFGGPQGLNWFAPEELVSNRVAPPVRITRFLLNNEAVPLRCSGATGFALARAVHALERIDLSWREKVIGFEFAALNFIAPERNRYRYTLEGFDEDWTEAGSRSSVTYTNLDPGEYVLRVQGSNNDGVWNEEGATLALTISAPPWRTWYAYAFYALVLVALGYAWYRYRLREATRELQTGLRIAEARSLEREDFRRRSAADFHDESGAKLTRIGLHTGLAKQRTSSDPATAAHLEHIEQAQRELSAGIRDLIWSMDPGRDTLLDVLDRLSAFALTLFDRTETRFQLEGRNDTMKDVKLHMEQRRAITLIMKEAMNNCAKHADAEHCTLAVQHDAGRILFRLKDDGKGFDPAAAKPDSYGARTMPERAKGIGAELEFSSAPGTGTEVRLRIHV
ncbi:MAG TPA: two-component regulator propeller domain-containing protein [Flavobacteriales bacterium]|nr:two-component regulator propeller domain-containing protein [Flavobacteriales bacterium]HMR26127.1 two-component regulator propeller domain-containing protein [Flavobacteriales bacterium]